MAKLGQEVEDVLAAGADMIHVDVMDNHYVPNLTIGPFICEALRKHGIKAPLDVHLMIEPVDAIIPAFAKAGATCITFHPEATPNIQKTIELIRTYHCQVGLAINPETSIDYIEPVLDQLNLILMMTVHPGFAGQKFIADVLPKIKAVRELIDNQSRKIQLSVDGGINTETITQAAQAGADMFVAGSAIFGQKIKIPAASRRGIFISFIDRLRGKAARTATKGERSPAPLENPQAKSPTRQAAGKSSHYKKMIDELRNQLKQDD